MRKILMALAVLLAIGAGIAWWQLRPLPVLTVTTWAGAYGRAQAAAQMRPYAAVSRVDVHIAEHEGGLDDLIRQVQSRNYQGDVIDFELPDAVEACHRGLLERIDAAALPPGSDGVAAAQDFIPGAIGPCWVGSIAYSQAIIFDTGRFAGPPPKSAQDFFDTIRFPGRRALNRTRAKGNLEMALLADGVAPKIVYPLLSTPGGIDRAFTKLQSLKPGLIWWGGSTKPMALVRDHAAAFATALNADIYDAAHNGDDPGVIWDRQLYQFDVFAIPAGDPHKDTAWDFIRFATGSAPLAGVADWVPYGPARRSSLALVSRNPETHQAMTPWLPTAPDHFATAFALDDEWWRSHGAAIAPRWQAFVDAP
jgi:putative spermidine/putrescine transport system substrate-binding protein